MTSGYYCAIFPFCDGGKKKDDKKTKAFYDWATTGIPVISARNISLRLRWREQTNGSTSTNNKMAIDSLIMRFSIHVI